MVLGPFCHMEFFRARAENGIEKTGLKMIARKGGLAVWK